MNKPIPTKEVAVSVAIPSSGLIWIYASRDAITEFE